jgi:hypothetical protein
MPRAASTVGGCAGLSCRRRHAPSSTGPIPPRRAPRSKPLPVAYRWPRTYAGDGRRVCRRRPDDNWTRGSRCWPRWPQASRRKGDGAMHADPIVGEASTTVRASPAEVFAFVIDLERYRQADHKIGRVGEVRRSGDRGTVRFSGRIRALPGPTGTYPFTLTARGWCSARRSPGPLAGSSTTSRAASIARPAQRARSSPTGRFIASDARGGGSPSLCSAGGWSVTRPRRWSGSRHYSIAIHRPGGDVNPSPAGCSLSGTAPIPAEVKHLPGPDNLLRPYVQSQPCRIWCWALQIKGAGFAGTAALPCARHLRRRPQPTRR